MRMTWLILAVGVVLVVAACGDGSDVPDPSNVPTVGPASTVGCADVVEVHVGASGGGTFAFDVTVRSADTGWDKYADLWEVVAPDGTIVGSRILAHPHVDEQPFTRSQTGIVIPGEVATVTVRARDSVEGFCGAEIEVDVPR